MNFFGNVMIESDTNILVRMSTIVLLLLLEYRAFGSPPGGGEWGEFRQNSDLFEKVGWGVTPRRDSPPLRGGVEGTFGTPRGESLFQNSP